MDKIKSFESSELAAIIKKYSPFFNEARKRILFTLSVFALTTIIGFVFYESIIKFLIKSLSLESVNIVFTSPFQFINLAIACGITTGLLFSFPFLIAQVLFFLKPALKKKEYKMIIRLLPLIIILFLIGFAFGAIIMKWQIDISLARSIALGIGNVLDISRLLTTVLLTSALMGIGFEFPIILLFLMRVRVIKHQQLSKKRLWVYLGSFIFTLFLPLDSVLADVFLCLPFIILFELTLVLNYILERKKAKSQ